MNRRQRGIQRDFKGRSVKVSHPIAQEAAMSSLKKALSTSVAAVAVSATLFAGSAPAQAHDGRNAALIGGLIVGAIIGGALSQAQEQEAAPAYYPGYHRYPAYGAVPPHRYRERDRDWGDGAYYRNGQEWD
jgi:hypothetical protein